MADMRACPRIKYKLEIDLFCERKGSNRQCYTHNVCNDGMFVVGVLCLRPGDTVNVALGDRDKGALELDCIVNRVTLDGVGVKFTGNSAQKMAMLRELLTPEWDGRNLWDGMIKLAPWCESTDFSDWMRLTSLLSHWQHSCVAEKQAFDRSLVSSANTSASSVH
jgi:hypothetical protein